MILPEYRQGLSILSLLFYTRNKYLRKTKGLNFCMAVMKITAALFCEIVHIFIISAQEDTADIIKDFVAIGFIVEIDNLFAKFYQR